MAEDRNHEAPGGRLLFGVALLALTVLAAVAFGRVFKGAGASLRLGLAAAIATLLAVAFERRHVLLATAASAAGLAAAVALMVFPETTTYGFPTAATFRSIGHAFRAVVHTAAVEVAPALPLTPLLLAGITAVWAAAFAAHTLAVRASSPFLAIVPPASLLAFAGIVLQDGARRGYVVAFLAAAVAVLFADGLRRVRRWGPLATWQGRRLLGVGPTTTTRGARRVTIACLAVAAFTPWVLPGFGASPLLRLKGGASPLQVSIDPIVDIRPALLENPAVQLFTVRSEKQAYWRFLPLDTFDGRRWRASNIEARGGLRVQSSRLDAPEVGERARISQRFTLDRLAQPWLPAAFDPALITLHGGTARFDPRSDVLFLEQGSYPGFSYEVVSNEVVPTPDQLDEVTSLDGPAARHYTQLPARMPAAIREIARKLTQDEPTPYRKIIAVQQFLRGFLYDEKARPGHGVNDMLHFLNVTRRGYCEQFAGTMAVLLRALDIPARVAMGFTPGAFDAEARLWRVTTQNAHTWVEVMFPKYGWLAFEPTPTRTNPTAEPYAAPAFTQPPVPTQSCAHYGGRDCERDSERGGGERDPVRRPELQRPVDVGAAAPYLDPSRQGPRGAERPWRTIAVRALLLLLVLLAVGIPVAKLVRRRLALARAGAPGQRVLAAYEVLAEEASDVGLGRWPHETLREYATRLAGGVELSRRHLERLVHLAARAAYSRLSVSARDAEQAIDAGRRLARDIRRSVGPTRRVIGLFRVQRSP